MFGWQTDHMNPSRWHPQSLRSWPLAEYALIPLRAFLGFTFLFAGLQKLANPGFFDANNSASIQAQLVAASTRSPIGFLVSHLVEHATFIGAAVALGEVAIGIGTILGLWTRIAALGGLTLSLGLFLTVSFHANPYYTGSDLVFAFAWIPFIMAGAGTHLSWDARIARKVAQERNEPASGLEAGRLFNEVDRRTVVVGAGAAASVAAASAILAAASAGLGRAIGGVKTSKPPTQLTTTMAVTDIGSASQVAVGGSAAFTIPSSQEPGIVLQPTAGNFVAYNAACPHAGCTVSYYKSNDALVCPCHTSIFKVSDGSLVSGPAPTGLASLNVVERNGNLYLE